MEMTFRWYGSKFDTVTLEQIRQIPGVTGVITTLYDTTPGEVWTREAIHALKEEVEASGLHISGIESVNIHDAIKIGSPDREQYIDNYIETLKHLGEEDIHLVCYNFMPVFDWTRTELARVRPDGSTVLAYKQSAVDALVPEKMFESIAGDANGAILPGWEPERMAKVKELFDAYRDVDDEKLFANLKYFLERIMPVCNEYDIKMAIHPDDPAWSVFGLPRIIINKENILRMMKMVDDPHNGMTFCSGSYGTNLENDLPDMIRSLKGRIHFAHVRNLKFHSQQDFEEAAHLSSDGSFDMYEIMKALYDIGFDGPIRPDHGRMIWGEKAMPGYGLYDRALGATYLNFMPVFDWTRTELARVRPDGSTVLAYKQSAVDALVPEKMFESIAGDANGAILPGWEPERMAKVKELFDAYRDVDDEKLFANLKYFLERIMPVCNEYDIKMAIHPDDPAWSVFGLPRIIINKENILRMMKMVDDPHNGMTFCSGSYGTNLENDLPDMIRSLKGRIHFAHVRNLKFHSQQDFEEAAHLSSDGSFDMYEIMKALYDIGFDGPIRPDHGRMIWGEKAMPGYGLYDRALGATYLNGLWEAIDKSHKRGI